VERSGEILLVTAMITPVLFSQPSRNHVRVFCGCQFLRVGFAFAIRYRNAIVVDQRHDAIFPSIATFRDLALKVATRRQGLDNNFTDLHQRHPASEY
jgi:hypothetical protein